jgi:hypothetical protein
MTKSIEYLDRLPADWFVLDVMREKSRGWNWVALMIDVEPDDFVSGSRPARGQGLFLIPGKYRNREIALEALEALMATRH